MFSIGLPLFIVGNITDGEDNLAMIIPGAIMFGVGAFVAIFASLDRNGVWKKGNYFGAGPGEQELVGGLMPIAQVLTNQSDRKSMSN